MRESFFAHFFFPHQPTSILDGLPQILQISSVKVTLQIGKNFPGRLCGITPNPITIALMASQAPHTLRGFVIVIYSQPILFRRAFADPTHDVSYLKYGIVLFYGNPVIMSKSSATL